LDAYHRSAKLDAGLELVRYQVTKRRDKKRFGFVRGTGQKREGRELNKKTEMMKKERREEEERSRHTGEQNQVVLTARSEAYRGTKKIREGT